MKTTVIGFYPKIGENVTPNLRTALHRFEQGKINTEELQQVYDETTRRVIGEQEEAGLDEITDGLIRWDDLLAPCAQTWGGMERNGLLRFFDNNAYYRQPIISGPITYRPATVDNFRLARSLASRPVKCILPGPFSFGCMSQDNYYGDGDRLTMALAEALHQEALALQEAGATHIQFNEPSLCVVRNQTGLADSAMDVVVKGLTIATSIYIYFGAAQGIFPDLMRFSVDRVGVDCVSRPENLQALISSAAPGKDYILGLIDARNTKMEDERELLATLNWVSERIDPDRLWLSPSCGLEFLPHQKALDKMRLLVAVARRFNAQRR